MVALNEKWILKIKRMNVTNLLWTGGWDSSFRLVYLILEAKKPVQPFYLIDPGRKSKKQEYEAMDKIARCLHEKITDASSLLLPTKYINVSDLSPDLVISEKCRNLSSRFHVGTQYDWLARFSKQYQIPDLELSIENALITRSPIFENLSKYMVADGDNFRVAPNMADKDLEIFQNFQFPLFYTTKLDMKNYAKTHGFYDILQHTWFCLNPKKNEPCGWCRPCKDLMKSGFAFRIPVRGKARYYFYTLIKKK
ncbi:MAG: hypothetical protein HGB11_03815 [Chlorobiales bacterium]|nr:hypothetical protein [Chlorobiales bacterium]